MEELIKTLQEYNGKGASLKACTIVLKENDDRYKNILITTDTWGELYVEDIP